MWTLPNKIPLPQSLSDNAPRNYADGMHVGLFYCRFVHGWHSFGKDENKEPKPLSFSSYTEGQGAQKKTITPAKDWVEQLHMKKVGDLDMLAAFSCRQLKLVTLLSGKSIVAKTDWHFATGLGNGHPVENGFAWHPTLGVPYLTGAAVKGLLRAWCEVWLQWNEKQDSRLLQWFGDTACAGDLIFFDALPTAPVMLKADVMTPHMRDWYEKGDEAPKADGSNIPADWHDPVPVPFLVVDKNQSFQFSLACRATESAKSINLDEVAHELEHALAYLGAGAKTAAGYGRMQRDTSHEQEIALEAERQRLEHEKIEAQMRAEQEINKRRAEMTPLQRELDEWSSSPRQRAEQEAGKWIARMGETLPEDRLIIAGALKTFYEQYGRWSGGSKQHKEQIRKIKEILNGQAPKRYAI